jgi:hypothetical protein
MTGLRPFHGVDVESSLVLRLARKTPPAAVSDLEIHFDLSELLVTCWSDVPQERPSIMHCLFVLDRVIADPEAGPSRSGKEEKEPAGGSNNMPTLNEETAMQVGTSALILHAS